MTIMEGIHALADWLAREVCPSVKLKVPSNERQTKDYEYRLANPSVHRMYVSPSRLAKNTDLSLCPGILVQLANGSDRPVSSDRDLKFNLTLCVWNPGMHAEDGSPDGEFTPTADGWQDVWNLMDSLLEKLRNVDSIGGVLRVKAEEGFDYGPYKEGEAIVDFYPLYFAELKFSCAMAQAPPTTFYTDPTDFL